MSGTTRKVPLHRLRSVEGRKATLLWRMVEAGARLARSILPRRETPPGTLFVGKIPAYLAREGKTGQPRGYGRSCSGDSPGGAGSRQRSASEQATNRSIATLRVAVTARSKCGQWTTTWSNTDRRTPQSLHPNRQAAASCGVTSQARADRTGPWSGRSLNGTEFWMRSCHPLPNSPLRASNVTAMSAV
jgi:hypothetical protein